MAAASKATVTGWSCIDLLGIYRRSSPRRRRGAGLARRWPDHTAGRTAARCGGWRPRSRRTAPRCWRSRPCSAFRPRLQGLGRVDRREGRAVEDRRRPPDPVAPQQPGRTEMTRVGAEGKAAGWLTLRALAETDGRLDAGRWMSHPPGPAPGGASGGALGARLDRIIGREPDSRERWERRKGDVIFDVDGTLLDAITCTSSPVGGVPVTRSRHRRAGVHRAWRWVLPSWWSGCWVSLIGGHRRHSRYFAPYLGRMRPLPRRWTCSRRPSAWVTGDAGRRAPRTTRPT